MTATMPHVMLLAAGLGTRMRPLTFQKPKALIEVAGKPLVDHVIDAALAEGCAHFVINAHHMADQIEAHIERLKAGLRDVAFAVSSERERLLDTGGGLRKALPLLGTDPVLTMNTDSFWLPGKDRPIARLVEAFGDGGADAVLLCVPPDRARGYLKGPDFLLTPDGAISKTTGRPVVYAGVALVARILAGEGPEVPFSLYRHFETARERGRLRGVEIGSDWYHVGDPAAIARSEQLIGALV